MNHPRPVTTFFILLLAFSASSPALADRTTRSLAGEWLFQRLEEPGDWKTVSLPASFEEHEGTDFDGVGTYKRQIPPFELPPGMRAVLHFQAVATLAEVTFNGQKIGSGGDLETRSTAFEERKSHQATQLVQPGQKVVIAVRVCDWQGAGGLFRPVVLSTAPLNNGVEILK